MFIGKGRFVNADKIRGQDIFQVTKSVFERIAITVRINGNHLSIHYGNTFNFLKYQFPHLIIPVSHNIIRAGKTTDQVFNLLCQRRGCVNDRNDFFLCMLVDNEFVFHCLKSLLLFHLPEEAQHGSYRYPYAVQKNWQNMHGCILKTSDQ